MAMTRLKDPPRNVISLPTDMRVRAIAERLAELQAKIAEAADLELDGSAVAQADTSTVQTLLLIDRELAAHGHKLVLIHPSPELREVLTLAGATELLTITP
jgi:anti-anti-sigma regulatory factor